jgi:hypothetical protein
VAKAFDPYRDWLGLDGPSGAINHYRLLGLKLFEADPQKIAAAADATIGRIKKVQTASHQPEQQQLLSRLVAARRQLLDAESRARYNATLGATTPDSDEPIPFAVPIARDAKAPAAKPTSGDLAPVKMAAADEPVISEALWKDSDSIPRRLRTTPRSDWSGPLVALASFMFVAALLAAGGLWLVQLNDAPAPVIQAPPAATQVVPSPVVHPPADPAADRASAPLPRSNTHPPPAGSRAARDADEVGDLPLTAAARERPATDAATNALHSTTTPDEITPDEAKYRRATNQARVALASRDLPRAARQLDLAGRHARDDSQRAEVARLRALATEVGHFFDAVRAGLQKLQATDEIRVGDWIAVVVETGPERLSLFDEGSRRDYTLATLPFKAALFIAAVGANENLPEVKRAIGAFQLVDPEGDVKTARRLWNSAAAGGQSVDELLPLVEDGAMAIRRDPVPDAPQLEGAVARATARFATALDAARAPAQQSELAGRLLLASRDCESPLDQYALLVRAGDLAALAVDARVTLQVVDEMGRWFELDALAKKSTALALLVSRNPGTTRAKVIARRALELADAAVADQRVEAAKTLADTALAAARKSRDSELVQSVNDRRREITALAKKSAKADGP